MSGEEQIWSVAELAVQLKRSVETLTEGIWVGGEAGRIQRPVSGHVYFTLKDEEKDAVIDCVLYRREALRFGRMLEEGSRIQLRGRASFYPPRGRLQWIVDAVRKAGRGALLLALEKLKARLAEEGLFAPERKRALPEAPRVVGVVTSRTGAAFADICTVAQRRGRVRLVLAPALVQGEGAAESLIQALDRLEKLPELDVIIVGRGGGSQEDLMAFNEERLVRRLAACRVPVVSAVGHEIDTSLCDLVADARAATPSQAAELVVPDARVRQETLLVLQRRLARAMQSALERSALHLHRVARKLGDPRFLLAEHQQYLDELKGRQWAAQRRSVTQKKEQFLRLHARLAAQHPRLVLAGSRTLLLPLEQRLHAVFFRHWERRRSEFHSQVRALSTLSPLAIVGRGYAVVETSAGHVVQDATELSPGQELTVRVRRGTFVAEMRKLVSSVENHDTFKHEGAGSNTTGDRLP